MFKKYICKVSGYWYMSGSSCVRFLSQNLLLKFLKLNMKHSSLLQHQSYAVDVDIDNLWFKDCIQ